MKKKIFRKKYISRLLIVIAIFTTIIILLNIHVTTQQGIDYQVHTVKIPLYLKILDFMDRHYNYNQLVKKIIKNEPDEQKRVMKIFSWTYHNIRKQPENLPIIDDHAWHIIVRGYGVSDQASDVFTTLCNYVGMDSFFYYLSTKNKEKRMVFSFVRLHNRWYVFDPYNGVYFTNTSNKLADMNALKRGDYKAVYLGISKTPALDYKHYFVIMPDPKDVGLKREKIQSPFKRFIYQIKKWID